MGGVPKYLLFLTGFQIKLNQIKGIIDTLDTNINIDCFLQQPQRPPQLQQQPQQPQQLQHHQA